MMAKSRRQGAVGSLQLAIGYDTQLTESHRGLFERPSFFLDFKRNMGF